MKNHILFYVSFIALLIAYCFPVKWDVSDHRYNSLTPEAQSLLSLIHEPFTIECISPDPEFRKKIQQTVALFQEKNPYLHFKAERKQLDPNEKTRLGLEAHHHLLLQSEHQLKAIDLNASQWGQKFLTHTLYQMLRLNEKWTLFLQGHGEADPFGENHKGLLRLSKDLKNKGIRIASLHLGTTTLIPDNTQLLVIANPRSPLLPKEMDQIRAYIQKGGNLLWFTGPNQPAGFKTLAKMLGVHWPQGLILDPQSHALGTPDPAITLVQHYPPHPLNTVDQLTVFPWSTPIQATQASNLGWAVQSFLISNSKTYLKDNPSQSGPFDIGISLSKGTQRVALMGSAHCFNNATLHNYGNLELANNLFNWLNEADFLITHKPKQRIPVPFTQASWFHATVYYVFPYGLPLLYLFIGWRCRRPQKLPLHRVSLAHQHPI